MQVALSKALVQSVGVAQVTQCSQKLTYATRPMSINERLTTWLRPRFA
jgi:hypothetical protein